MSTDLATIVPTDYHADKIGDRPSLSSSIANAILTSSPKHAWTQHPRLNPAFVREEEQKFDLGNTVHALILQGLEVAEICHFPDWRTKAAKEARELARSHGRIPMLADQWEAVQAMHIAVAIQLEQHGARPIPFTAGKPEQTLVWEEDGVLCRARLDWLHDDHSAVDDLKTTSRSANPDAWSRALYSSGCDVQYAFYLRGLRAVLDREPEWRWVVAETYPPFALSVISPGPDVRALADAKVDWALEVWKQCLGSDTWPSYPTEVCFAELPAYEESRWLAREAREAA